MATLQPRIPAAFEAEAYDFADPTAAEHIYMISSTPRAGGTLLSQQLWHSGVMGAPDEYFGFYNTFLRLVRRLEADTVVEYASRLIPLRTSANGVFGFKAHYDHLQFMLLTGLMSRFRNMKVIAIQRRDLIAQAVSHARALQTGQWTSQNKQPTAEPAYNADLIRWSINHLDAQRRGWETFFEKHKVSPIMVDYDALAADPSGTATKVIDRVGFPKLPVSPVDLPEIERQGDSVNAEWIARFRAENESQ